MYKTPNSLMKCIQMNDPANLKIIIIKILFIKMNSRLRWIYRAKRLLMLSPGSMMPHSLFWIARTHFSIFLGGLKDCKLNCGEDCKYILIEHADLAEKEFLIRGSKDYTYHKEIWDDFLNFEISPIDHYKYKVMGGGFIMNTSDTIHIGGKSNAFGASDHMLTKKILKEKFPNKKIVIEKDDWRGFGNKFKF